MKPTEHFIFQFYSFVFSESGFFFICQVISSLRELELIRIK